MGVTGVEPGTRGGRKVTEQDASLGPQWNLSGIHLQAGDCGSILDWEDPLEEGMATHSRILVWRIPMREEPGGI